MTEFGPGIFALAPEDAIRKAGSIGRPNFFVDAPSWMTGATSSDRIRKASWF